MINVTHEYKLPGIFLPGLTLLLIGLKLTHNIDLSWFWVLSPMLLCLLPLVIMLAISIGLFAMAAGVFLVSLIEKAWRKSKKAKERK